MQSKSLSYYFKIILKRWYVILIVTIICSIVGFTLGKLSYQPEFRASTEVLTYHPGKSSLKKVTIANIKGKKVTRYVEQRKTDLEMMPTYKTLVTSDLVLDNLIKKISVDDIKSVSDLRNHLDATINENTLVMSIEADASNAEDAVKIANSTANAYKAGANDILNVGRVEILRKATISEVSQNASNSKKYGLLGIFAGLYIGCMIAILWDSRNRAEK
ncbi:YveK family protein [Loigolactobacillus zhaoyuanensis]|uniref:Capsular polysaccharide biosynthesis protein CpsC n=1 Tax=Loigolactobacillus zhaoyuanensis TaxID=2486017 RepID=A0ABW8UJI1_9LACO